MTDEEATVVTGVLRRLEDVSAGIERMKVEHVEERDRLFKVLDILQKRNIKLLEALAQIRDGFVKTGWCTACENFITDKIGDDHNASSPCGVAAAAIVACAIEAESHRPEMGQ